MSSFSVFNAQYIAAFVVYYKLYAYSVFVSLAWQNCYAMLFTLWVKEGYIEQVVQLHDRRVIKMFK